VSVQGLAADDSSEICPTPDAPRVQTKAPTLDIYWPAPVVVVDTGKPDKKNSTLDHKNKTPQGHDKTSGTQDHEQVPSQNQSKTSLPKDYRFKTLQEHTEHQDKFRQHDHGLRTKDHLPVSSLVQTGPSVPEDCSPPQAQTKNSQNLISRDIEVQTKPEPHISRSRTATRFEDSKNLPKPLVSQYRGKLQTFSRPSRAEPAENSSAHDKNKRKIKKTSFEDLHHHPQHEEMKGGGQEVKKGTTTSRAVPEVQVNSDGQQREKRGDATSGVEVDEDYAMKYRLGLVPRRSNEAKRRSEYQREFQWKQFELNSPLLSAAQVTACLLTCLCTYLLTLFVDYFHASSVYCWLTEDI